MDREEARFILGAGQASGSDADRPEMREALEFAKLDPETGAWLARERSSDAAISRKLRELEPPPGLRARLLAGGRASRSTTRRRHVRWWFAIAASLFIVAGVTWWAQLPGLPQPPPPVNGKPSLIAWQQKCIGIFGLFFGLDVVDESYPRIESHLVSCRAPVVGELPFNNEAIEKAIGCKVLDWNGSTVSLACFQSEGGEIVHLFVMPRGAVDESLVKAGIYRAQVGDFATVSWLQRDLVVMVAAQMPAAELEGVLSLNIQKTALIEVYTERSEA